MGSTSLYWASEQKISTSYEELHGYTEEVISRISRNPTDDVDRILKDVIKLEGSVTAIREVISKIGAADSAALVALTKLWSTIDLYPFLRKVGERTSEPVQCLLQHDAQPLGGQTLLDRMPGVAKELLVLFTETIILLQAHAERPSKTIGNELDSAKRR